MALRLYENGREILPYKDKTIYCFFQRSNLRFVAPCKPFNMLHVRLFEVFFLVYEYITLSWINPFSCENECSFLSPVSDQLVIRFLLLISTRENTNVFTLIPKLWCSISQTLVCITITWRTNCLAPPQGFLIQQVSCEAHKSAFPSNYQVMLMQMV